MSLPSAKLEGDKRSFQPAVVQHFERTFDIVPLVEKFLQLGGIRLLDESLSDILRGCLKSPDSRQILSNMCSLQLPESWDESYTAFCELGVRRTFQTSSHK